MKPFIHHSSGNLTFGIYPVVRVFLDWRDASDGRTFIWPRLVFVWRRNKAW